MDENYQIDSTSIIMTLWDERKKIIISLIFSSILAVVFALSLPKWYRSSATIVPSSAVGGDMFVVGGGAGGALSALGFGAGSDELNKYITILGSRQVLEHIVNDYDLRTHYGSKTLEGAINGLGDKIDIAITGEGALVFGVIDQDSVRARDMALSLLDQLGSISSRMGIQAGLRNSTFIQTRIDSIEQELALTEGALRDLSSKYGAFDLPKQMEVMIESLIQLEVRLAEADIEYNVAVSGSSERRAEVEFLRLTRDELERKLEELIGGRSKSSLLLDFKTLPEISRQFYLHTRKLALFEAILHVLYPQLEQAGLQQARDMPTYHILDYPRIPGVKFKPKRSLVVISIVMFSMLITCLWIIIKPQWLEMVRREKGIPTV